MSDWDSPIDILGVDRYRAVWREGVEAFKAGKPVDANPYPKLATGDWCTAEHWTWEGGWEAAFDGEM